MPFPITKAQKTVVGLKKQQVKKTGGQNFTE